MLTIIVSGRNDDYGQDFRGRLFQTALHNCALLSTAGVEFEYFLAEWNPRPDGPPLSEEFISTVPNARAVIIPADIHERYTLNPEIPFHEMPAKNAAIRRSKGDVVIVTNPDILFSESLVERIAEDDWNNRCLYRAHRIEVKPGLDWDQMKHPANQLPSGEGQLCPPYYLGAGGDFCLAKRSLWHALRGFNERIRFSTRAKDWQFFLSAAAEGIDIQFIGDVYHLDHEDGFRTPSAEKPNTQSVHFGRWWDIEFGLPVANTIDWGFGDLTETSLDNEGRLIVLNSQDYQLPEEQTLQDLEVMKWVTRSSAEPDSGGAFLMHAICAAHRQRKRLTCVISEPGLLATLSGFEAVASRFSIDIRSNSKLPNLSGYTRRAFTPEPSLFGDGDWVIEETNGTLWLSEYSTGRMLDVLPDILKVSDPGFNPVLARRLLHAFLHLQNDGCRTIAIYGDGGHTQELLRWGIPDNFKLVQRFDRLPESITADAILLSSASSESDMLAQCRERRIPNVIALYTDWPKEMWETLVTA